MWRWLLSTLVVAVAIVALCGCCCLRKRAERKEPAGQSVTLSDVPAPARATIDRLIGTGEIESIDKEEVGGKVTYDVEAAVQGKHVEYDIAADGTVLSSEQSVPYASLPEAVRLAAEKYFGSADGLAASQEVEEGKTFYEVEGNKGGTAVALKLSDTGKILEEEKE